jgi:hypothetical protein
VNSRLPRPRIERFGSAVLYYLPERDGVLPVSTKSNQINSFTVVARRRSSSERCTLLLYLKRIADVSSIARRIPIFFTRPKTLHSRYSPDNISR